MKKVYINLFVPSLDRNFDIEIPINLEMKYVVDELQKSLQEQTEGCYIIKETIKLYDKSTGGLINQNNIVKYSGLKNGASIMLI